jgi:outer membrane lipoprotein
MNIVRLITICGFTLLLSACLHPISSESRSVVDPELTLALIDQDPTAYLGRSLMLGGTIIALDDTEETKTVEVLEWRLNVLGEPYIPSDNAGRFLLVTRQHLPPELYTRGRLITLTGTIEGVETRQLLSGADQDYPVIRLSEIHLWETPYRYGISSYQAPETPNYVGPERYGRDHPYDPGYNDYPYTPYWYRIPYP